MAAGFGTEQAFDKVDTARDAGGGVGAGGGGTTDDYPWSTSTTGVVSPQGAASSGRIEVPGDMDLFAVELAAGVAYSFTLSRTSGGLDDPYLVLYSPGLNLVAGDDDGGGAGNARILYTAQSSGTHYLGAMDSADGTGAYFLAAATAAPVLPSLQLTAERRYVPEGASATFTIDAGSEGAGVSLAYAVSGIHAADVSGGPLSGRVALDASGRATVTVALAADQATEGTETLRLAVESGQEASVAVIDASRPASTMTAASKAVLGVFNAFYGSGPTPDTYGAEMKIASVSEAGYASAVAGRFAGMHNLLLAESVLSNLWIDPGTLGSAAPQRSYTALRDALILCFDSFPEEKGQVVLNLTKLLSGLESDATWGTAALLFNAEVAHCYGDLVGPVAELALVGVHDGHG